MYLGCVGLYRERLALLPHSKNAKAKNKMLCTCLIFMLQISPTICCGWLSRKSCNSLANIAAKRRHCACSFFSYHHENYREECHIQECPWQKREKKGALLVIAVCRTVEEPALRSLVLPSCLHTITVFNATLYIYVRHIQPIQKGHAHRCLCSTPEKLLVSLSVTQKH